MGVERILGRRAVTGLSAEDTINTGQFSQVIWSLLWIPNEFTADSWNVSTESLTSGQHRLWPKSLLSPIGDVRSNNSDTSSLSVPIELAEHHIGVKKPTALYKESLEIQTTMQLFEKQQASTIQEKTKLNNGSPSGSDIPLQKDSVNHGIGGSGEFLPAVDHADEEEDDDDLFASSPSPALVEDPITFHDTALGQEKPIAMDSVDEASASMFTPTHQPESHLAPAKYDVSPTDPDGRNKTYQIGFETMITDDDFNFFDANAEVPLSVGIQQMPYEEYGDLSDADFGVNLNQPPTEEVLVPDGNPGAHSHENFANTDIADRLPCVAQANDEVDIGGADLNNETMVATPQSDNDLWNDESDMAGHIPVEVEVNVECAFDMKDPMLPSQSMPLNLAETQQHTLVNISSAPAHDETANAPAMILPLNTALMPQEHHEELGRDSIDYRQPLEWTLVDTTEKMIPVGFDEVSFKSLTHGNDRNGRPRGLALEGICIADKYGDGRVRHRPQLLQLLKQEASFLQQQAHPRLPFHLEGLDFEVEACSPKSTDTGSDNVFSDSLDDASEITALSNTGDGSSDKQGLFTLGQYPFSSDEHLLSTGAFVVLEDHDSITLRKRFTESKHSGEYFNSTSMAKPHIWQSASTFCRREFYEGSSYANRNCNTATPCPSPLKFSESCEYVGKYWITL
ncbi:hypothetical protein QFC19_001644 [Naganishia cerealis]|uniref:Uncharacterized protein n=1 Tax=Naganishia cerealis TaxID=610337 RepID=A0ACC2WFP5_9TREE|nr:hypothetical protein QFC19_001644 [Naganishia cerealis]